MERIVYLLSQRDQNFLQYHFVLHDNGKCQRIFSFLKSHVHIKFLELIGNFPKSSNSLNS